MCHHLFANVFLRQFSLGPEKVAFLVLLAYTAHWRLCDHALYKSIIDFDIDNSITMYT